jgi:hypothetical protein
MNAIDTAREARSRNLARLRKLTIGTAALGVAATSGLGWLAAMTYTGSTTAATAVYAATSGGTTPSSTTPAPLSAASPTVTSSSGSAHVASGGS